MIKVHWTNRAKARLKAIYNNIAKDSPKAALETVDRLTARSKQLNELP